MNSTAGPYLSIVVTTRNDDHGGDPLKRLRAFVNTFDAQCRRTGLDAEVIVVEWNPPPDKPRVSELLRPPSPCSFTLRFIEVPAALHAQIPHGDVLPLFQMMAKNVGIRRARGRFVLSTNIDIIFSDALVERFASESLATGRRYRVDRHDIESDFPVEGSLDDQMVYCRTHQLRLHTRSGTHPVDDQGHVKAMEPDILESAGIVLGGGWHVREGDHESGFFRWASADVRLDIDRTGAPDLRESARLDIEAGPNPYQPDAWVELEIFDGARLLTRRRLTRRSRIGIALADDTFRHDIAIRMVDSSGGRDWLPLFERRQTLCYRVYRVALTPGIMFDYDMRRWQRANENSDLQIDRTPEGLAITTAPEKYSYCVRYGPFESRSGGRYEFQVEYSCISGNFGLTAMDDAREQWLPSTVTQIDEGDISASVLSVEVQPQTKFSVYVSNHRPDGDAVSEFVLRRLTGSVSPGEISCGSPTTQSREIQVSGRRKTLIARVYHGARSAASSVALGRTRERFGARIVADSEHVRDLETRLKSLTPYAELASVERLLREHRPPELHQNASGDFQLLAREHWLDLRGFAEFATYSMNIDGLFESVADAAGIKEHVFEMPCCIYHLEHEKGSGWTPEGEAILKRRMADSGITWLDATAVHIWSAYMAWLRRPMIFNRSDWGFGDVTLREITVPTVAQNA